MTWRCAMCELRLQLMSEKRGLLEPVKGKEKECEL